MSFMNRILFPCLALFLALLAPLAGAETLPPPVPAPFPPGFTESQLTDPASGMAVQLVKGGKPGAPLVVLIHGLGQQASRDWIPVLPALAGQYQVLMFDLPGFGRSERPDVALSPRKYADLVAWLIQHNANEPVFVVGHSLGGAIALRHSHDYPAQVKRLLLIDAAGMLQTTVFARHLSTVPDGEGAPTMLRGVFAEGSRILNHFSRQLQDLTAGKAGMLAALAGSDQARSLLYKDSGNINAALGLVNEDFSPVVRQVKVPVWMLWGGRDPVAPVRTGLALDWLMPLAELDILPGVGHVPMAEATDETVKWMLSSLQGPLSQEGPPGPGASQGDAVCDARKDMVYRGHWRSIRLKHCARVRIEDATIGQLVVERSTVDLVNVEIIASGTALEATNSTIAATGLRITAPRAWNLNNSRLDLAAFQLQSPDLGQDRNGSFLFLSLGHWCDGADEWRLHDVYRTRKGSLGPQLGKTREGSCTLASR